MGSGIISKYRLCVYFQKFRDDERYIKQFLLFNTNQYFQRDLSIAIEGRNGKTLYLPAQSELATIPTNNSIAVRYQGKYFLFPTNTSMWSTVCMVQLYSYTTESGRWIRGNFQYSIGGNTVGLNYKIKIEAYENSPPWSDIEHAVNEPTQSIQWSFWNGSTIPAVTTCKIKITCEGSGDEFIKTLDFSEGVQINDTVTFNLVEP